MMRGSASAVALCGAESWHKRTTDYFPAEDSIAVFTSVSASAFGISSSPQTAFQETTRKPLSRSSFYFRSLDAIPPPGKR